MESINTPEIAKFGSENATFLGFQQVCQIRYFLGGVLDGGSPPKVWRQWASETATLALYRHIWKPCFEFDASRKCKSKQKKRGKEEEAERFAIF